MIKNTFLSALVIVVAGCGGDRPEGCLQDLWQSGFLFSTSLTLSADQVPSAIVTTCRNAVCAESQLASTAQLPVELELSTPSVSGDLFAERNGLGLDVTYPGTPDQLHDGDVYEVTLRTPDGTVLFNLHQAAIYKDSEPSGPGCGLCRQFTIPPLAATITTLR